MVELYDAEIEYMDRELSRVLAALEELGVRDDTLVVVLADHGERVAPHLHISMQSGSDAVLRRMRRRSGMCSPLPRPTRRLRV